MKTYRLYMLLIIKCKANGYYIQTVKGPGRALSIRKTILSFLTTLLRLTHWGIIKKYRLSWGLTMKIILALQIEVWKQSRKNWLFLSPSKGLLWPKILTTMKPQESSKCFLAIPRINMKRPERIPWCPPNNRLNLTQTNSSKTTNPTKRKFSNLNNKVPKYVQNCKNLSHKT